MFYTGRPVAGEEAFAWGIADVLVPAAELRAAAIKLAEEFADGAPLAVSATRATLRQGLANSVKAQLIRELAEQTRLSQTQDHQEGLRAVRERRPGSFRADKASQG